LSAKKELACQFNFLRTTVHRLVVRLDKEFKEQVQAIYSLRFTYNSCSFRFDNFGLRPNFTPVAMTDMCP
jgi:hypothetical protein